jgi:hypothetical protein
VWLRRGAARWSGPKVQRSGATASGRAAGPAEGETEEGREEEEEPDQWGHRVREREEEGRTRAEE